MKGSLLSKAYDIAAIPGHPGFCSDAGMPNNGCGWNSGPHTVFLSWGKLDGSDLAYDIAARHIGNFLSLLLLAQSQMLQPEYEEKELGDTNDVALHAFGLMSR